MGLSVNARAFLYGDGLAVAGQDLRLQATSALLTPAAAGGSTPIAARQGVRQGNSGAAGSGSLQVLASSGMNITVNAGMAFVQGTAATNSGTYTAILDATGTITVATSDPTNPRIDNVIVQITDLGSSSSTAVVKLQTGTPAPSPVAPALPANSLLLATVAVAANTSTIVAGNITDARVFTVAAGGILPAASLTPGSAITAPPGYMHDLSSNRLRLASANIVRQPLYAAFGAVSTLGGANVATNTSSGTNLVTATVTTDGATELCIFASWTALTPASGTAIGDFCQFFLLVDGAAVTVGSPYIVRAESTSLNAFGMGNLWGWSTPGAGSHTIALSGQSSGHAFTVNNPYIRVAPSLQG